jgi:acyl-CoA synthetase (AMP-forming)/AMP-acid ligase II
MNKCSADNYTTVRMHGIGDILREHRRSRPQMIAAVDGDIRLTWPQLDARVNRLANVLRAMGVGQGERVLWLGQNSFRLFEGLLAAAKLGAVFCPLNWRMSGVEMAHVIDDFQPRVTIWQDAEIGAEVARCRELAQHASSWIRHDGDDEAGYEALLAAAGEDDDDARIDSELPLLAIYTAAFDGRPNAALLPHSTLLYQSLVIAHAESITEKSVFLNSGPLFHLGTMLSTLAVLTFGGRNVFLARVDAEEMLQNIARERVTHAFVAQPTIVQIREINADGKYDVSSLWSSPLAPEWANPLVMPAGVPFNSKPTVYGQTEIMGFAVMGWLGGEGAGRTSPLLQMRIADDEGNEVGTGVVGEICARGVQVMSGYYNRPEENARRTSDGWHRTRDLGKRLEDGSIVFIGPKTTMIKSGVENIYPAEVETCLRGVAAVQDVCVIGVPDPVWTQNVKALVVLKPGQSASADELIAHCRDRMASYKKPKQVVFVESLPRGRDFALDRTAVDAAHGGGGYPSAG